MEAYCCFIDDNFTRCAEKPLFVIQVMKDPYDETHACRDHVGYLIDDGTVCEVYSLV